MICKKCKSTNIQVINQVKSIKKKRHGCLWWLFIGVWLFLFFGIFILLFRKRGSKVKNKIVYVCGECGYRWS